MVEALAGYLIPEKEIAILVQNPATGQSISPITLRKHFRKELDTGFAKIKVRHHMALFKNVEEGNVTAQIWWDKTRNRITERIGVGFNVEAAPGEVLKPGGAGAELSILEVARRVAFVLNMGAEMAQPSQPAKPKPKTPQPQPA